MDAGSGTNGSYSLSGSGMLVANQEVIGDESFGAFTQFGGTNSVSNGIVLGENLGSSGSYSLQGGLLIAPSISMYSGSASFTISGGTLRGGSDSSYAVPMTLAAGGSAVFDSGGGKLAIQAAINGSGRLVKSGAGLLVLSGSDSYSGGTMVSAGTLEFAGAASVPNGSGLIVGAAASVEFSSASSGSAPLVNSQPVPEPSTLAVTAVTVLCLIGLRRQRK